MNLLFFPLFSAGKFDGQETTTRQFEYKHEEIRQLGRDAAPASNSLQTDNEKNCVSHPRLHFVVGVPQRGKGNVNICFLFGRREELTKNELRERKNLLILIDIT